MNRAGSRAVLAASARRARATAVILPIAFMAACGQSDEEALRAAFAEMRDAAVRRDYEKAWEYVDSGSKESLSKQLRGLKDIKETDALFEPSWRMLREQFGLRREDVVNCDVRQYFVAMLRGLDRVRPELRARQIDETRGRELVSIAIDGSSAEMKTRATSGAVATYTWVKEGTWKCKAEVPE